MPDDLSAGASAQVQAMSEDVLRELQSAVAPAPQEETPPALSARGARIMQSRDETIADLEELAQHFYWSRRRAAEAGVAPAAGTEDAAAREAKIAAIRQSISA